MDAGSATEFEKREEYVRHVHMRVHELQQAQYRQQRHNGRQPARQQAASSVDAPSACHTLPHVDGKGVLSVAQARALLRGHCLVTQAGHTAAQAEERIDIFLAHEWDRDGQPSGPRWASTVPFVTVVAGAVMLAQEGGLNTAAAADGALREGQSLTERSARRSEHEDVAALEEGEPGQRRADSEAEVSPRRSGETVASAVAGARTAAPTNITQTAEMHAGQGQGLATQAGDAGAPLEEVVEYAVMVTETLRMVRAWVERRPCAGVLLLLLALTRDGLLHHELEQLLMRVPLPPGSNQVDSFLALHEGLDALLYGDGGMVTFRHRLVRDAAGLLLKLAVTQHSLGRTSFRAARTHASAGVLLKWLARLARLVTPHRHKHSALNAADPDALDLSGDLLPPALEVFQALTVCFPEARAASPGGPGGRPGAGGGPEREDGALPAAAKAAEKRAQNALLYGNPSEKRKEVVRKANSALTCVYHGMLRALIDPALAPLRDALESGPTEGGGVREGSEGAAGWGGGGGRGELPDGLMLLVVLLEFLDSMEVCVRKYVELNYLLLRLGAAQKLLQLIVQMPYLEVAMVSPRLRHDFHRFWMMGTGQVLHDDQVAPPRARTHRHCAVIF